MSFETVWDALHKMADLVPFHSESDRISAHEVITEASQTPEERAAAKKAADDAKRAELQAQLAALDAQVEPQPLTDVTATTPAADDQAAQA